MDDVFRTNELISALADGQLRGDELARAVALAATDTQARAAWQTYHLIGDVLRSEDLAAASTDAAFLERLSSRLAAETVQPRDMRPLESGAVTAVEQAQRPAANDAGFRWKLVAGLASVVAVTAVGWTTLVAQRPDAGAGLAAAPAPSASVALASAGKAVSASQGASPAPVTVLQVQQQVNVAGSSQIMIRDPRLDELMSAHRQLGDASALQMPAGFLRNATFEAPTGR